MFNPDDNFFWRFLKSPHHLWLAGLTLGIGFLSANVVVFGAGIGLYALGWVHLPDTAMYKNWVKAHLDKLAQQADSAKVQAFIARRNTLINQLTREGRARYQELGRVCQEIVKATQDGGMGEADDPRLRKLDELMWTYLRLLVMEGSLQIFINSENEECLPAEVETGKQEVADLEKQVAAVPAGSSPAVKQRLLDSKKEKLAALLKRQARLEEARDNRTLVAAEQERLVEQIKLLRSDAVASRNAEALTDRINATVDHLTETNKLISEMDQFKDLVADDLPVTATRLGFDVTAVADSETKLDAQAPPRLPARNRTTN